MASLLRNWIVAFVAPRPLIGALYLPRYFRHWREYARRAGQRRPRFSDSYPCLTDWTGVTPFDAHYFYQSGWLARRLRHSGASEHVDIGSSVQMISVISAMTAVTHIDYRPLQARLPGLACVSGDILRLAFPDASVRSLSCLHVLEHVGLGRYGDPIDPEGSAKGARELVRVLAGDGRLYVSVPVGRERTCFNAHRVFAPESVLTMFSPLKLETFALVDDRGEYHPSADLRQASGLNYGCGMFEFTRG